MKHFFHAQGPCFAKIETPICTHLKERGGEGQNPKKLLQSGAELAFFT
jgi:hypothetical protein